MKLKTLFIIFFLGHSMLSAQRNIDLGIIAVDPTSTVISNVAIGDTIPFFLKMYSNGPDDVLVTDKMSILTYEGVTGLNTDYFMLVYKSCYH